MAKTKVVYANDEEIMSEILETISEKVEVKVVDQPDFYQSMNYLHLKSRLKKVIIIDVNNVEKYNTNAYDELGIIREKAHQKLLIEGFDEVFTGMSYLEEAICIYLLSVSKKPKMSKEIYPIIAEKHHTTDAAVEKGIRDSIRRAHCEDASDGMKKTHTPSNLDYIKKIVECVKNDMVAEWSIQKTE